MDVFVTLGGNSADEVVRAARSLPPGVGVAMGTDLLVAYGAPLVAALDETGPVLVTAPLAGDPRVVQRAVGRLVRHGASWVTVSGVVGTAGLEAAVAAARGGACRVALGVVDFSVDDATAAGLVGMRRGQLVGRWARIAAGAGADGVVGTVKDVGVVAQIDDDLEVLVGSVSTVAEVREAGERGGSAVITAPGLGVDEIEELASAAGDG
jgi:orotidine-5'-phosphate decarboxylase